MDDHWNGYAHGAARVGPDTFLSNARAQAIERGYARFPIIDVDAHHFEDESWAQIVPHIERGPVRDWAELMLNSGSKFAVQTGLIPTSVGNQTAGGRIKSVPGPTDDRSDVHRDVQRLLYAMDMIGIDYSIMFPTPMLTLGMHPNTSVEVKLSGAYTEWLVEEVLPHDSRIKLLVYLPFNDPEACLKVISRYADDPGVCGFMVTSVRHAQVHDNVYARVYRELEERQLPLAFHAAYNWSEPSFAQLDKFIGVHALGFTFSNMVHVTNMVINGIPERYPNLKLIWIESGLAWVPFLMQRLDHEYLMRVSDAPLLKRLPSEYMRDMFYASQPMELIGRAEQTTALQATFEIMDAEKTVLWASDYPHWDWDPPSVIYDLPFLDENAKRRILGGNAMRLLRIDGEPKRAKYDLPGLSLSETGLP